MQLSAPTPVAPPTRPAPFLVFWVLWVFLVFLVFFCSSEAPAGLMKLDAVSTLGGIFGMRTTFPLTFLLFFALRLSSFFDQRLCDVLLPLRCCLKLTSCSSFSFFYHPSFKSYTLLFLSPLFFQHSPVWGKNNPSRVFIPLFSNTAINLIGRRRLSAGVSCVVPLGAASPTDSPSSDGTKLCRDFTPFQLAPPNPTPPPNPSGRREHRPTQTCFTASFLR